MYCYPLLVVSKFSEVKQLLPGLVEECLIGLLAVQLRCGLSSRGL
jgi:hypothetical protein